MQELAIEGLIAKYVPNDAVVAIGTSQLGALFLRKLAFALEQKGLQITFVPTSAELGSLAIELGLQLGTIDDQEIDVAIEFPDSIDPAFNFLKTDSESLVRDKMICQSATDLIAIVPRERLVSRLKGTMALEIAQFGWKRTLVQLEKLGKTRLKKTAAQQPFITESGNFLALTEIEEIYSLEDLEFQAKEVPGVLETGLFIGYADRMVLHSPGLEVKSRIR